MSIFLAYAATFPDAQVLLMFVIPVKMKWMGIAYSVLLAVEMIQGTGYGVYDIFYRKKEMKRVDLGDEATLSNSDE